MVYEPTFVAYELRRLCHTNPNFYAIWAVFVGGGLQFIDVQSIEYAEHADQP